jgi:hypothetical protein
MPGKVGAVAAIAAAAEEEDLDRGDAALVVHGDDVGIAHALEIDVLAALDLRQRPDPVAIERRGLEIERRRRLLHPRGEGLLGVARAAAGLF